VDAASLHVTFAAQHPTGIDFLEWLMSEIALHPVPRRDIPVLKFELPPPQVRVSVEAYLSQLAEVFSNMRSPAVLNQFLTRFRAGLGRSNQIALTPHHVERNRHVNLN
jgi:hypothetical protein